MVNSIFSLNVNEELFKAIPELKIGLIEYSDVQVSDTPTMLRGRFQFYQESLRLEHQVEDIAKIPQIQYIRSCFKTLGIDPARYRPSSEALCRRVLQGKDLPTIHSAADINNFFSLRYMMPSGLYDKSAIQGSEITMRIGKPGESYLSLAGKETNAQGKWVTVDQQGPFGSPIIDAERTKVTPHSTQFIQIIYLPYTIKTDKEGLALLQTIENMMLHVHGGNVVQKKVITKEGNGS